ncbi:MAG: class I SAM-dependent methyltransferase [Anaerolineae bacterium]|nr:class I SAM-dependent methyltransferase [Anaerolineae bacterium]
MEIGRYYGASTLLLALAVGPRGQVTSIDIAPQGDEFLRAALHRYNLLDRVGLVVADANSVSLERALDFVFIDGDHSYTGARRDHNRWMPCLRPGGYLIHHDMAHTRPHATQWHSLARLRAEILDQQADQLELVREVGSLSVFRRLAADFVPLR